MAWLRSEQSLQHHPKTKLLQSYLNVSLAETIGRLHMLWYWCLDYAFDGDISHKDRKMIENACQIPLKLLVKAGFVDSHPYRRIHSWYEIQGNYLRARFKDQPEKWKRIKEMYENDLPMSLHSSNYEGNNSRSTTDVQTMSETVSETNGRTNKETREATALRATPRALPNGTATARIENDEPQKELGHEDFVRLGWRNTNQPTQDFEWVHLEHTMTQHERVQSKLREKQFLEHKWG